MDKMDKKDKRDKKDKIEGVYIPQVVVSPFVPLRGCDEV